MNRKKYTYIVFITSFIIAVVASFSFGALAAQKNIVNFGVKSTEDVQVISQENIDLKLFFDVWNALKNKSIHYDEVSDADRVYGAIEGLTYSLKDPYTEFMPPEKAKEFNESITGSFEGIGAEIGIKDDILTVITPLKNSPAEKSGLRSGDKIIMIDGVSSTGISIDEAISKIRGKAGTKVVLDVYREGEQDLKKIEITRDTIVVPTIDTEILDNVFVIHIYNFGEKSSNDFVKALNTYKQSGLKHMIIDLRGNPGGYLNSAVDMASYFVPKGKTVVTEDFVKENSKEVYTSYGFKGIYPLPKVLLLVDGGSASASEILAGALRDYGIAKIVGTKSFGKGSVQELIPMSNDTFLKITIARWLTPNGTAIDKNGLDPDIEIKRIYDEKNPKKDNQLEEAIKIIKK